MDEIGSELEEIEIVPTTHIVEQGECLASIAQLYGFTDYRAIYDYPANAGLKQMRPDPNILYPGDQLVIPDKDQKTLPCATDQKHRFQLTNQRVVIRIRLRDGHGNPLANKKYQLTVAGALFKGQTDGNGLLQQPIPADASDGELKVLQGNDQKQVLAAWKLSIGSLDPHLQVSGVQARLNNLGFVCGQVDGILGPKTSGALQAFQTKFGLSVTGQIDGATRDKLRNLHDGVG